MPIKATCFFHTVPIICISNRNVLLSAINKNVSKSLFSDTSKWLILASNVGWRYNCRKYIQHQCVFGSPIFHIIGRQLNLKRSFQYVCVIIFFHWFVSFSSWWIGLWSSIWCWNTIKKWPITWLWICDIWKVCFDLCCWTNVK